MNDRNWFIDESEKIICLSFGGIFLSVVFDGIKYLG